MKNMLVIADLVDSPQIALEKAKKLAGVTVAKIHVVAFCYESLLFVTDDKSSEVKRMLISRTQQYWENYMQSSDFTETVTYEVVWEKDIISWLIKHCQSTHYDLIIKSGHRSETTFHTPTDWQLFRESTAPVYCVGDFPESSRKKEKNGSILVALDLLTKSKEKNQLNEKLIESAFQLSVQMNVPLEVCCAIKIPTLLKDMDLIDVPERADKMKQEILSRANTLLDDYGIDGSQLIIEQGEPWQVVVNAARDVNADCIVLGSTGRRGVSGTLIGNTSEKVIHYSGCDLLVIPPL